MITRSQLFVRAPVWLPADDRSCPPSFHPAEGWLYEPGSLTQRLRALCGRDFRVRVLRQDRRLPFPDEAWELGLQPARVAVVREVLLQWGDRPVVAARSIIPTETLQGAERRLARLGSRPLGEVLFRDPRLTRSNLELAELPPDTWQPDIAGEVGASMRIWGRRSLYSLGHGDLLVAEFFLPSLFLLERTR